MVTGLRGHGLAIRAGLVLAGLTAGMTILAVPSAEAAAASQAARFPIPTAPGDQVGKQVAISGAIAAVGAPGVNDGRGTVYVFVRAGKTWHRQATLRDPRHAVNAEFGARVAVSSTRSGTFVLVGAPGQGAPEQAYMFARSGKKWYRQATLAGPAGSIYDGNDDFGDAVALSGITALVSTNQGEPNLDAPIYVFAFSGKTWHRQAILTDPDPGGEDNFGDSVAVSGASIVVGAPQIGCAYVFARSGGKWALQARLVETGEAVACPAEPGDGFGSSVAISDSTIAVGTTAMSDASGVAVVFTRSGATWSRQAKLTDPHAADGDGFGSSVALSGHSALVGAPFQAADNCGAAYEFTRSGVTWSERAGLDDPVCSSAAGFGSSVAESGGTALVGAPGQDSGAGAAYWQALP